MRSLRNQLEEQQATVQRTLKSLKRAQDDLDENVVQVDELTRTKLEVGVLRERECVCVCRIHVCVNACVCVMYSGTPLMWTQNESSEVSYFKSGNIHLGREMVYCL